MKEKRTERKELLLTPSEMKAFQAAASEEYPHKPLTQWIVEACWEKLRSKPIFINSTDLHCPECGNDEIWQHPTHFKCFECGYIFTPNRAPAQKTEG